MLNNSCANIVPIYQERIGIFPGGCHNKTWQFLLPGKSRDLPGKADTDKIQERTEIQRFMEEYARQKTEGDEERTSPSRRKRTGTKDAQLSPESVFVAFVFFVVLSQFLIYAGSEQFTQPFRPLIVLILTVQVIRRGRLRLRVCQMALVMSVYQILIWFFLYPRGGSIRDYLTLFFYFMMLFSVASFPWNQRELRLILLATFAATFFCALVFFFSNNMTDFSDHEMQFLGKVVNRNKNAYAFAFGVIIGRTYLAYGKGRSRLIITAVMLFESYCLLYSKCRGAFLGLVIAFVSIAVGKVIRMNREGNPFVGFYVLFCGLIMTGGYFLIKNSVLSRLVDSENLSGRDDGIEHALELFRRAPLLGKIFGNGIFYESANTEGIGVHFVYLTYLLEAGIIGMVLVILIFLYAIVHTRGEIQWSFLLFAISRTFFEGMDYYIFIPLILSICLSNYERLTGRSCREVFYRQRYIT